MLPDARDVTSVLLQATGGSAAATEQLLSIVYDELRAVAERLLQREAPGRTLQATELVHEAYMRLVDQTRCEWQSRAHFLAVASRAMRRILIDRARRRRSVKHGGGKPSLSLDEALVVGTEEADAMLLALEDAMELLAVRYPDASRVVEMRFFGGLTLEECACVMGFSPRTVSRHWDFAQAWLSRAISAGDASA